MDTRLIFEPVKVNLNLYYGQTVSVIFPFTDANGQPIDFTGLGTLLQIKKRRTDTTYIKQLTNLGGLTVGGTGNSSIIATIAVDFPIDIYVYDLWVTFSDGSKVPCAQGLAYSTLNVSR